eukprot:GHRR01019883.1.p2 GENE.GHRR01019883.1~~GHRR01019883.1.p2  ORF type:complete len:112 (+),score=18.58 GHRR01019883.1:1501-1836(+)
MLTGVEVGLLLGLTNTGAVSSDSALVSVYVNCALGLKMQVYSLLFRYKRLSRGAGGWLFGLFLARITSQWVTGCVQQQAVPLTPACGVKTMLCLQSVAFCFALLPCPCLVK